MPVERYKKEQELLRLLWLEGGGYNRHELASVLALSADSVGRTIAELQKAMGSKDSIQNAWPEKKEMYYRLAPDQPSNPLVSLYRLRSLRESEQHAYLAMIRLLAKTPASFQEVLLEICRLANVSPQDQDNWKKTTITYLKELLRAGLIQREPQHRGKYSLSPSLLEQLTLPEIHDLADYIEYHVQTEPLSTLGWQILDKLRCYLTQQQGSSTAVHYRHTCLGNVLEEYLAYELLACCQKKRLLRIAHYPRQQPLRYHPPIVSKRRHLRAKAPRLTILLPLKVLYDRTYSRWYLWGENLATQQQVLLRLDTIQNHSSLPMFQPCPEPEKLDEILSFCRLTPGNGLETLKVRFFNADSALKAQLSAMEPPGTLTDEINNQLLWTCNLHDLNSIKPWLRSFGPRLEILEPLSLRQEIADEWQRLVNLYE